MSERRHIYDAGAVSVMLAGRVDALVREILPGGRRFGREWVCGSVAGEPGSSCSVHLTPPKAGVWADFATGECGDALDLVAAAVARGDRRHAFKWALSWLGLADGRPIDTRRAYVPPADPAKLAAGEADTQRRQKRAQQIWLQAAPDIRGTPVERYLVGRGIDLREFGRQPRALRFHPRLWNAESGCDLPAMVAAISDGGGHHIATHRTWLAVSGDKVTKAALETPKMVLGQMRGGTIRLSRGASGKPIADAPADEAIAIGEGIETCLSVALACPEMRVLAGVSLAGIAGAELPDHLQNLIVLADNDVKDAARQGLLRTIRALQASGRNVRVARSPWGSDFNDALLKRQGRAA